MKPLVMSLLIMMIEHSKIVLLLRLIKILIMKFLKPAKITFTANKTCDINKELMKHLNKYLDKYNEIPNDKQQKKMS